jgi:Ni,Fe-hydrogenase maturation factor
MRTLLIACGNSLRRDDGAAREVLRLIAPAPHRVLRTVQQLTPELAEEVAHFDRVVFLDADAASDTLAIEAVESPAPHSPLTHFSTPAEIVAIARGLYGFTGEALLCRIPAGDFSPGEMPEPEVLQLAQLAAARIASWI